MKIKTINQDKLKKLRKLGTKCDESSIEFDRYSKIKSKLLKDIKREIELFINPTNEKMEATLDDYFVEKQNYFIMDFKHDIFHMANKIVKILNDKIPQNVIHNNSLKNILLSTITTLMMNQMEIIFFSIYLEYIIWDSQIKVEDNILLTGLYTKILLNTEQETVLKFLSFKKPALLEHMIKKWMKLNIRLDFINIDQEYLNIRFMQILIYNSNCRYDYIDYNTVVESLSMNNHYLETITKEPKVVRKEKGIENYTRKNDEHNNKTNKQQEKNKNNIFSIVQSNQETIPNSNKKSIPCDTKTLENLKKTCSDTKISNNYTVTESYHKSPFLESPFESDLQNNENNPDVPDKNCVKYNLINQRLQKKYFQNKECDEKQREKAQLFCSKVYFSNDNNIVNDIKSANNPTSLSELKNSILRGNSISNIQKNNGSKEKNIFVKNDHKMNVISKLNNKFLLHKKLKEDTNTEDTIKNNDFNIHNKNIRKNNINKLSSQAEKTKNDFNIFISNNELNLSHEGIGNSNGNVCKNALIEKNPNEIILNLDENNNIKLDQIRETDFSNEIKDAIINSANVKFDLNNVKSNKLHDEEEDEEMLMYYSTKHCSDELKSEDV